MHFREGQDRRAKMKISLNIITPPETCHYLADKESITECDLIIKMTGAEYEKRLLAGWRHFGRQVFRPKCENCNECKSLRIPVRDYKPNRSQSRNFKANNGRITLEIQEPALTDEIMDLYDRFHAERSFSRDWPIKENYDAFSFDCSFVDNPFPVEQWMYREDGKLCGVGYVDGLKCGLSAIYFFHDPNFYSHGIGIWNVMSLIHEAQKRNLPHVYMGYYVKGCQSLEYKAGFKPNEILNGSGKWVPYS